MPDVPVHLRVPAATKARWVRASRAAGQRLTDYITQAVEARVQQQIAQITIPDDVSFSDLRLERGPNGAIRFDWAVIERVCAASAVPIELLRDGPEDNVAALIVNWYAAHRQAGGGPDPVAEDLLAEVRAEDAAGQHISYAPGRA